MISWNLQSPYFHRKSPFPWEKYPHTITGETLPLPQLPTYSYEQLTKLAADWDPQTKSLPLGMRTRAPSVGDLRNPLWGSWDTFSFEKIVAKGRIVAKVVQKWKYFKTKLVSNYLKRSEYLFWEITCWLAYVACSSSDNFLKSPWWCLEIPSLKQT